MSPRKIEKSPRKIENRSATGIKKCFERPRIRVTLPAADRLMECKGEPAIAGHSRWTWTGLKQGFAARRGAFALAFLVLASLAYRIYVSRECSLWLDEASTHQDALEPWPAVLKGPSREHPPLMFVLVKLAIGQFGESETALRSVSLFFGCVLLLATYESCLELGLTVRRALLVVATLALHPFFIRHATEARQYAMLASFLILASTRALRGAGRFRDLVVFAASAFMASVTQYFGLAYSLSLLAVIVLDIPRIWRQTSWLGRAARLALLLGTLGLLGGVAVRAMALGRYYGVSHVATTAGIAVNTTLLREITVEFSFLASSAWPTALEALLAVIGLALLTWRLRGAARLIPLGIGIAPCVAVMFISADHFIAARYLVASAIFYHLGACVALFAALDRLRDAFARGARARWLAPVVSWLTLAAALVARLREFPTGFNAGAEDYRGLQHYFRSTLAQDTRLVAYYGHFGQIVFKEYDVGSKPIWLEKFQPVRGINRYLVVELDIGPERQAELESTVEKRLGISPEEWRSIPLVPVPHSRLQSAVVARSVELLPNHSYPAEPRKRRRKH
jgi:hypothetical protein